MTIEGGGGGGGGRTGLINSAGGIASDTGAAPGTNGTFTAAGTGGLGDNPPDGRPGGNGGNWGANGIQAASSAGAGGAGGIRGSAISNAAGTTFTYTNPGPGTRYN